MKEIFSLDNPVWNFLGKMVDMVVLTGLWLICSLPIVTIGASTAALYYVTLKLERDQEGYTIRSFFRAFRDNLKQGMLAGLIALAAGGILSGDIYMARRAHTQMGDMLLWTFLILAFICLATALYLFPLMARCRTGLLQLVTMAFVMAMKNIGWTIFMLVCLGCLIAVGVFVCAPVLVIAVGVSTYVNCMILNRMWKNTRLALV